MQNPFPLLCCRCADLFSCHELYERAFTCILQHFEEVVQEPVEEFLELTLPQLSNILEEDKLNVKQEETVFEAVKKWIQHAPEVRSDCIVALLPKVRDVSTTSVTIWGWFSQKSFISSLFSNAGEQLMRLK